MGIPQTAPNLDAVGAPLHRVVRRRGVTCQICTAPVDGHRWCWRCRTDRRFAGLAGIVVPLIYAIAGTPSAELLSKYKNHPVRSVRATHSAVVGALLAEALAAHERCLAAAVGVTVDARVVVPSLTSRPGVHPVALAANAAGIAVQQDWLVPTLDARCDRVIRAEKFRVYCPDRVDGSHVLVIDDVWTTGSNAQSAALALRRAGARAVSVVTVGRWLNPDHPGTAAFVRDRLSAGEECAGCPVTGSRCL
ncbi:hypothetical protein [Mycobacterium sp. GA-2829]|uniref:hypothetical protein n=1 Tax=Mycobacterium sp. GA-2829 TaxID=1772283 RepID=UPI00074020BC|nr:hypothetical protein [Mycobacterium sp. GA-2829]KUI36236.1 hypothetical protein AU194_16105 [Mycobacterium sp. GA-2829]